MLRTREATEGIEAVYGIDRSNLAPWDSYNREQQAAVIELAYLDRQPQVPPRKPGPPLRPEDRRFERYIVENILNG